MVKALYENWEQVFDLPVVCEYGIGLEFCDRSMQRKDVYGKGAREIEKTVPVARIHL